MTPLDRTEALKDEAAELAERAEETTDERELAEIEARIEAIEAELDARDVDGRAVHVGDRVERVVGTSVPELFGHVRLFHAALTQHGELTGPRALVRIEGPGEPGIGHQFVCPVSHLRLAPDTLTYTSPFTGEQTTHVRVDDERTATDEWRQAFPDATNTDIAWLAGEREAREH